MRCRWGSRAAEGAEGEGGAELQRGGPAEGERAGGAERCTELEGEGRERKIEREAEERSGGKRVTAGRSWSRRRSLAARRW